MQLTHVVADSTVEYDPPLQRRQAADEDAEAAVEYDPASQLMHVTLLEAPTAVEYVPGWHHYN